MLRRETLRPFVTILLGSIFSGLWTGLLQMGLMDSYLASNPTYVEAMAGQPVWAPIPFTLGMGAVFGVIFGGVAVGIKKARS